MLKKPILGVTKFVSDILFTEDRQMIKRRFVLIFLVTVMSIGFMTSCTKKSGEESKVIKVGAILPLTGNLSNYGVDTKKALELAVELYNKKNADKKQSVKCIFEDSQGKAKNAISACKKLIDVDGVIAIMGPITSPEVLSIGPLVNNRKVPMISPSSTSVDISKSGSYVYRTINADNIETSAFAKFLKENYGCLKIGVLANQAAGTLSYANTFKTFYSDLGCEIAITEIYKENLADFKDNITKILSANVDSIYISGVSHEIGLIIKQIRERDKDVKIFSYQSAEDARVVEIAQDFTDGVIFSSTSIPNSYLGKPREQFNKQFSEKFNKEPGIFASEIFDAFNIVMNAYDKMSTGGDLNNFVKDTKNFVGTSGKISFDKNGDVHKAIAIYEYKDKTPKPVFMVDDSGSKIIEEKQNNSEG